MKNVHKLHVLLCLLLFSWTALQSRAQNLSVTPRCVWNGGQFEVKLKAESWTDLWTLLTYGAAAGLNAGSGTFNFATITWGGLQVYRTESNTPDEIKYFVGGPPENYTIEAGSETIKVHIVNVIGITTSPAEPIKIGDAVTFTAATTPTDLSGDPRPSTLVWEGEVSGADLTATSTWSDGGYKAVSVRSDATWASGGPLGWAYQSYILPVFELSGLTVDKEFPDADESVIWTATLNPYDRGDVVTWTGGGAAAGTTGLTYTKSFPKTDYPGTKTITATCGTGATADKTSTIKLERVEIAAVAHTAQLVGGPVWTLSLTSDSSTTVKWVVNGPGNYHDEPTGTTITVPSGADPGKFSISVYPTAVPSRIAAQELWAVKITVTEASMVSGGGGFAEVKDDYGNAYSRPLWTQGMDDTTPQTDVMPVQCQRNQGVAMDAKFSVEPSEWVGGYVHVKSAGDFTLTDTTYSYSAGSGELIVTCIQSESTSLLPDYVDWQKNKSTSWKCSVDDGNFYGAGKNSRHAYYATLNAPSAARHTVVHLACKNTGAANQLDAVNNVWSSFSGRATKTWNDQKMYYYRGESPPDGAFAMIESAAKDGRCGAWAELLQLAFGVHSVSQVENVSVTPGFAVPTAPGYTGKADGFSVDETLPGQNTPDADDPAASNPAKHDFLNHALIKYQNSTTVYLFDPSYAKKRSANIFAFIPFFGSYSVDAWALVQKQFEDESISQFSWYEDPTGSDPERAQQVAPNNSNNIGLIWSSPVY